MGGSGGGERRFDGGAEGKPAQFSTTQKKIVREKSRNSTSETGGSNSCVFYMKLVLKTQAKTFYSKIQIFLHPTPNVAKLLAGLERVEIKICEFAGLENDLMELTN